MPWTKKGLIFCPDGVRPWGRTHASVPTADYIDAQNILRIYYSTRDNDGISCISFIEVDADNLSDIRYIHDKPILNRGEIGLFDDCGVMPSWIITRESKKFLYYIGWNVRNTVPYSNAVGLAVSDDGGITFKKMFRGAVLDRSKGEPFFVSTLCAIEIGDIYHVFYLNCTEYKTIQNRIEPRYNIKHATSENGIDFNRNGKVAIDYISNEEAGISRPTVIKDEQFRMWYSYRQFTNYRTDKNLSYKIGHARSLDGVTWQRLDDQDGLYTSMEGWDSEMVCYPHVLNIKGKLVMLYNGNGFGKSGFGYAEYEPEK